VNVPANDCSSSTGATLSFEQDEKKTITGRMSNVNLKVFMNWI
jgi:hypothetical protein